MPRFDGRIRRTSRQDQGPTNRRRRESARQSPVVGDRLLALEPLEDRRMLAGLFNLLKDINVGPPDSGGAKSITVVGATAFFVSQTPETGYELWKTDGTTAGTALVKDIFPG